MDQGIAPMSQEEYLLLNELIANRFGITFPEGRRQVLEIRLRPRLQALRLRHYRDYYFHLQCDLNGEGQRLAESVTNNETYFFRETEQIEALLAQAPGLAGGDRRLRILSLGCSSGEEPYTLALLAREHSALPRGIQIDIDAVDLDPSRIAIARQAEYGRPSLRAASAEQIARYFTSPGPDRWSLKPAYRTGVRFASGNLLELPSLPFPGALYDVLFCRNVLIYFAEAALHRAIGNFSALLRPGGLLFLGASESIIGLSESFETVRLGRSIAYQHQGS